VSLSEFAVEMPLPLLSFCKLTAEVDLAEFDSFELLL